MQQFAELFTRLDQTNKTTKKIEALADYFKVADDQDKLWTVALLSHRRPRRTVKTSLMRQWAAEISDVPLWLFEESYRIVGDLAETIALTLPEGDPEHRTGGQSLTYWMDYIKAFEGIEDEEKEAQVKAAWEQLSKTERYLFNKLITGNFRVGVSQKNMVKALSQYTGQPDTTLAHRIMGNWSPRTTTFHDLILSENTLDDISKPYPFYLAYPLEEEPDTLGNPAEWQAERKWDGIRGQVVVRDGEIFVWSRGEELVTEKFPEFKGLVECLPNGTVLDGEILPFKDDKPLTFNDLQTRIGRKNITKKILESAPVVLMCYDLLEYEGEDIRARPMEERRALLETTVKEHDTTCALLLSDVLTFDTWDDLRDRKAESRAFFSEGIMLKRKSSPYEQGRKKGNWWKWKIEPLTIDAVMIYAQRGSGRRANLYTDYTFAVWDGDTLVPFTKAYSGLTDKEFREVTSWVRRNTLERFGPVRSVTPHHVFEIAFEGINRSTRHKSGVALRFPRMKRWRKDKPKEEANTLDDLKAMLKLYGQQEK